MMWMFLVWVFASQTSAAAPACFDIFERDASIVIDRRQPELVSALESRVRSLKGNPIDRQKGMRIKASLYENSPNPIDELDKQLWALSRLNGGIEVGFLEVLGTRGEVLAISEFYIGTKIDVFMPEETLIEMVRDLLDSGVSFKDIAHIGFRHTHPRSLNSGYFSWNDGWYLNHLQVVLQDSFGYRFPAQMVLLWEPHLNAIVTALGAPESLSKRGVITIRFSEQEKVEDGIVYSDGKAIPLTGS